MGNSGVKIVRHILVPEQPPKTAHWLGFSRMGGQIVMDVGFMEMHEVVETLKRHREKEPTEVKEVELHVKVFDRFGISPDAFLQLKRNLDEIYKAMIDSGDIVIEKKGT